MYSITSLILFLNNLINFTYIKISTYLLKKALNRLNKMICLLFLKNKIKLIKIELKADLIIKQ